MTTLDTGSKATDQVFGTLNSTIWTTVEANTGIICACLPMLKKPLTVLFPKIFPRASIPSRYRGSNSNSRRTNSSIPAASSSWGRKSIKKPSLPILSGPNVTAKNGPGSKPTTASSDNTSGMEFPMGNITKTTSVKVQSADERCAPALSPNSKQHTRSVSNLVGQDFSFP